MALSLRRLLADQVARKSHIDGHWSVERMARPQACRWACLEWGW